MKPTDTHFSTQFTQTLDELDCGEFEKLMKYMAEMTEANAEATDDAALEITALYLRKAFRAFQMRDGN